MRPFDLVCCILAFIAYSGQGMAASRMRPAPVGAPSGAPREYTEFDESDLTSGFLRLAFGSDMKRLGESDDRIHKFDHRIAFRISSSGHVDRSEMYKRVLDDFIVRVPRIDAAVVDTSTAPDVIVRLVAAKDFVSALAAALGHSTASAFINQTNRQFKTTSPPSQLLLFLTPDNF